MKTFTYAEFIDAVERNGFEQAFGSYFVDDFSDELDLDDLPEYKIGAACAIGQAAINLGVNPWSFLYVEDMGIFDGSDILSRTWVINDRVRLSPPEIAAKLREEFKDVLDHRIRADEFNYEGTTINES